MDDSEERWTQIKGIWADKENQWLYALVGSLVRITTRPFIVSRNDFIGNIFPEIVGIAFTLSIIDRLNQRRQIRAELNRLKEDLIAKMGSTINDIAVPAAEELRFGEDGYSTVPYVTPICRAQIWKAQIYREQIYNELTCH
ncbi:MAG: hypothetical protein IPK17_21390 [Chloroflexi bacterium]|uniref:hypothetical protein n=1 Tax=Candidatus Flexifilum breve TaxID=3140694 RepID=UPI00313663AE|nr:hypothetical protein [Chloroflexota bacterium]